MTSKNYNFDLSPDRTNTNSVKWDLRQKMFGNRDAIPLWVADMDFETPDFILNQLKKRLEHPILGYSFRPDSFHEAFIQWTSSHYDWSVKPEWLSFAPGVVPAVTMLIEALTEKGDEIITQPPVYFPFFTCIEGTGRKLIFNNLKEMNGRLQMDFDHLESVISSKTRMIIISNPHNPGGSAWTEQELVRLGQICAEHNILVLSDEIHSDLVFNPSKHTPFAKVVPQENVGTITCMAASKTFNLAGLSTSLVVIPDPILREKYNKILQVLHVNSGNIFGSIATETAYYEGSEWLRQLLSYLKANRDYLHQRITDQLPGLRMLVPEATYMAWIDFSALGLPEEKLTSWLINEAGVAMNPGSMFGPGGEGFMRLNFACPRTRLSSALDNIQQATQKL